jgi:hypothetical protein
MTAMFASVRNRHLHRFDTRATTAIATSAPVMSDGRHWSEEWVQP